MPLSQDTVQALAQRLDDCQQQVRDTTKITDDHPALDWNDAYAIQDALLARKLARGARLVGFKAGLTSRAKMQQMGVEAPVFGFLTDDLALADGGALRHAGLIHPKVEPEIAFVLSRPLRGPGCHVAAVLAATAFVLPGIEVIDSRYRDFKFDLKSVIADNTSAAGFVVGGTPMPVAGLDLVNAGVVLERNGVPVGFGAGAAVLGHPAQAVAELANHLGRHGREIPAGCVVLSGGITEAVSVAAGDSVALSVQGLGRTSLRLI